MIERNQSYHNWGCDGQLIRNVSYRAYAVGSDVVGDAADTEIEHWTWLRHSAAFSKLPSAPLDRLLQFVDITRDRRGPGLNQKLSQTGADCAGTRGHHRISAGSHGSE